MEQKLYKIYYRFTKSDSKFPAKKATIMLSLSKNDILIAEREVRRRFPEYQVISVFRIEG
ncbi:hypothetical protein [Acetobacter malorum]|uniref:hypothetical protein n=1 Tax=Acetobacter malorum TaxID=178901 RepID=UPI000AD75E74|nr:hypothetical protein [Acetobacter malorum]